jgi:hypothetical protein
MTGGLPSASGQSSFGTPSYPLGGPTGSVDCSMLSVISFEVPLRLFHKRTILKNS